MPTTLRGLFNRTNLVAAIGAAAGFLLGNVWPVIREELHWADELNDRERAFVLKMIELQGADDPAKARDIAVLTAAVAKRYLREPFASEFTNVLSGRAIATIADIPPAAPGGSIVGGGRGPASYADTYSDDPGQSDAAVGAARSLLLTAQAAQLATSLELSGVANRPAPVAEALDAKIARVYVQVGRPDDRDTARALGQDLKGKLGDGWRLEGVEYVPSFTGATQVRYFYPADHDKAVRLAAALAGRLPEVRCRLIPGYANGDKVKPQIFEVWLQPGARAGAPSGPPPACR